VGEVEALEIAHRQLAEDVIEDRGRVFDRVVALHGTRRLKPREGEGVDIFVERHAVLQAERHRDHERVHQAGEGRALLGDVDEDVTRRAVLVEADVDVALVVADAELAADLDPILR